jgi:CHAT domain-containing protein/tetratricopeptide (TPR) repeat protein
MGADLEAMLQEAERLSDRADHLEAGEAWGALAGAAQAAYGPGDPRVLAAVSRRARSLADTGFAPPSLAGDAGTIADALAERSGGDSPEALFAAETALRLQSDADAAGAAEALANLAEVSGSALGVEHPQTLSIGRSHAMALVYAGDPAGGASALARLADVSAATLGPYSPETLETDLCLAGALYASRDLPGSFAAGDRALAGRERIYGQEHPDTLLALTSVAYAQYAMGNAREARDLFARLYRGQLSSLGPDHPDTVKGANGLATLQTSLGEYAAARELHEAVLEALEKAAGPDSPDALVVRSNLAEDFSALALYDRALEEHARVLAARERTLGRLHPHTVLSRAALAAVMYKMGDYAGARELLLPALAETEAALGAEHPYLMASMANLAAAEMSLSDYAAAREHLERALAGMSASFGESHHETAAVRDNLATVLGELGDLARARDLHERTLAERERSLGPANPRTVSSMLNLSYSLAELGDLAGAVDLAARAVGVMEGTLGPDHPDTLDAREALAMQIMGAGDPDTARAIMVEVLDARLASLGADHPDTVRSRIRLATVVGRSARPADLESSRDMFLEALEAASRLQGPYSRHAGLAAEGAGRASSLLGATPEAIFFLKISVDVAQRIRERLDASGGELGRGYLGTVESRYHMLFEQLMKAGRRDEALAVLELLKEDELRELEEGAAAASSPGPDAGEASVTGGAPDPAEAQASDAGAGTAPAASSVTAPATSSGTSQAAASATAPATPSGTSQAAASATAPAAPSGSSQAAISGVAPAVASDSGHAGGADLFTGTREEAAHLAWLGAAEALASIQAERAGLLAGRAEGALDAGRERRLAELDVSAAESGAAFVGLCRRAGELLGTGPSGGGAVAAAGAASLRAVQGFLKGTGAGLVYAVSAENELYLVVVTEEEVVTRESGVRREDLVGMALEFRAIVQDRVRDPRIAGKRLFDVLIAPIEADLERAGVGTLMLSLDGALRYVPVSALWDGENWLVQKRATVIFTRATAAAAARQRGAVPVPGELAGSAGPGVIPGSAEPGSAQPGSAGPGDLPGSVGPGGGRAGSAVQARAMGVTRPWPGYPPLPGVAAEIEAVVGGGGKAGVLEGEGYLDEAFDREALARSLASDAPVVHVASHFVLDPASLERTALLLGDGRRLTLGEMRSSGDFDFRGLDLLTLSACDTGSGSRKGENGREVESLGEVLQRAGASAVLATLLPVDDMSAPELMREFYRLRYVEGEDKAEALRGAQLLVMRDEGAAAAPARGTPLAASGLAAGAVGSAPRWEGKGFSHPYFWAPFVVMGDWR